MGNRAANAGYQRLWQAGEDQQHRLRGYWPFLTNPILPWTLLLLLMPLSWLSTHGRLFNARRAYESGFSTELEPLRAAIEVVPTRFWGAIRLDGHDNQYMDPDPNGQVFVGPPSPQLDHRWHELMKESTIVLTESEAERAGNALFHYPISGIWATPDVVHTLHCVDRVRRGLDPQYYFNATIIPSKDRFHIDHCLDHIRQIVMCHGDLSPIPGAAGPISADEDVIEAWGTTHYCRSWPKLKEALNARHRQDKERWGF